MPGPRQTPAAVSSNHARGTRIATARHRRSVNLLAIPIIKIVVDADLLDTLKDKLLVVPPRPILGAYAFRSLFLGQLSEMPLPLSQHDLVKVLISKCNLLRTPSIVWRML